MTPTPHTLRHDETVATAQRLMREHAVRHLPVLEAGRLAGVVSQRDLYLINSLQDVDPEDVQVCEAMTTEVYCVGPRTSVRTIAAEMAQHKYGSAVVMEGDRVVGVFTTTDALAALHGVLSKVGAAPAQPTRRGAGEAAPERKPRNKPRARSV